MDKSNLKIIIGIKRDRLKSIDLTVYTGYIKICNDQKEYILSKYGRTQLTHEEARNDASKLRNKIISKNPQTWIELKNVLLTL